MDIKPYPKNAKKHPDKQIKQIADSIEQFGMNQQIVVDKQGVIIVGHGRYYALQKLGWEIKPEYVKVVDLPTKKANAYRLADNKLNESDWDMDLVIDELKALEDDALLALTGFTKDLITGVKEDNFNAQEAYDKIIEPRAKLGDLFQMGKHRLLCGDSTREEDVIKVMNGELADMIWTDPPYNVDYNYSTFRGRKGKNGKIFNDNLKKDKFIDFLQNVFKNCYKFSKNEVVIYVCHAYKTQREFLEAYEKAGFYFSQLIIWLKERFVFARGQDYHRMYEPILFGWKQKRKHFKNKKLKSLTDVWNLDKLSFEEQMDIWYFARDKFSEYIHPTQKPVRLPERAIKKSSQMGGYYTNLSTVLVQQ